MIKKKSLLTLFIFFLLCLHRIYNPFEEDQKIFFASAHISSESNLAFPLNIVNSFELKPVFSRLLYYNFYSLTSKLYENKEVFIILNQFLLVLLILSISFKFSKIFYSKFEQYFPLSILISSSLIFVGSESFFQNEHLAIILLMFGLCLRFNNGFLNILVSAIVFALVSGIKGVTVLYSLSAIIYSYKYINRKDFKLFFLIYLILLIIVFIVIYPELNNAKYFSEYDYSSFKFYIKKLYRFFDIFIFIDQIYLFSFLSLLFGIFISIIYSNYFTLKNLKKNILKYIDFILISFLLILSILLQHGLSYHFFALLLLFILYLPIILSFDILKNTFNKTILLLLIPIFIIYIISQSGILPIQDIRKRNIKNFNEELILAENLKKIIPKNDTVLFLTDGVINFYINNTSCCREFYPISLQRLYETKKKLPSSVIKFKNDTYNCIINSDSDYLIIQDSWFDKNRFQFLYKMKKFQLLKEFETSERHYLVFKKIL